MLYCLPVQTLSELFKDTYRISLLEHAEGYEPRSKKLPPPSHRASSPMNIKSPGKFFTILHSE